MTEDEAKTKRCQESFGDGFVSPTQSFMAITGGSASVGYSSPLNCIGSGCMAWRWLVDAAHPEQGGYCGKAGKP